MLQRHFSNVTQASYYFKQALCVTQLNFCNFFRSLSDPLCWTKEHVRQWIQWAIKEFSLKDIDADRFDMDGKQLCKLTREGFMKLAPAYNGDILMAHLCVLRKSKLCS